MEEIIELPSGTIKNTFIECNVIGKMKPNDSFGENDVIQLFDTATLEIVLEFGTDSYDDYYPMFIASFYPQNMEINKEVN